MWYKHTVLIIRLSSTYGMLCLMRISRAGTRHYIPQILWHVITCQCPWYQFLAQHPSYMRHDKPLSKEITTPNPETSNHNADSVLLTLFNFYSRYPTWKYVCNMVVEKVVILKIETSSTLHIIHKKKITAESVRGFFLLEIALMTTQKWCQQLGAWLKFSAKLGRRILLPGQFRCDNCYPHRAAHICVNELGQHWFRLWLSACSGPTHYLTNCLVGTNFSEIWNKVQNFQTWNCVLKYRLGKRWYSTNRHHSYFVLIQQQHWYLYFPNW